MRLILDVKTGRCLFVRHNYYLHCVADTQSGVPEVNVEPEQGFDTSSDEDNDRDEEMRQYLDSDDTSGDPDYSPEGSETSTGEEQDSPGSKNIKRKVIMPTPLKQTGKKRIRHEENWAKNKAKWMKASGKSYNSFAKQRRVVPAKEIKPPCGENCRLQCSTKIEDGKRREIFQTFWGLGNTERQRNFISSCMTAIKRKYLDEPQFRKRVKNNAFHFKIDDKEVRVCKTFFKNTLAITDRPIRTVLTKKINFEEKRGKHGNHSSVAPGVKESIRNHIEKIPTVESHFCRAQTKRQYVDGSKTVRELHRDYVEECKQNNQIPGNYVMYSRIFNVEYNISFFKPKKDQCELCAVYENSSFGEKEKIQEKYETHLLEKDLTRLEKENDKLSDKEVAVYDLQAVLPCPLGQTSPFYYVSKLGVYNFTIFDLKTNDVSCYVWNEAEANRGAIEIGSCVLRYLELINGRNNEPTDVVFYSDNCTGQQKNQYLIGLYSYAVRKFTKINTIEHKYLITGHTQNEGDSAHSVIERHVARARKAGPIFIPEQYYTLIRTAKKSGSPYVVNEMTHKDFIDIKHLAGVLGIRLKINVSELKCIKFDKARPGVMFYKKSYGQHDYEESVICTSRNSKSCMPDKLKSAYLKKVGISEKKKEGLLKLIEKKCVPEVYSTFFHNL